MRIFNVTCDHCGEIITVKRGEDADSIQRYAVGITPYAYSEKSKMGTSVQAPVDLCWNCWMMFCEFINRKPMKFDTRLGSLVEDIAYNDREDD